MAQAVIFDMDGVLADTEAYHFEAEMLICEELEINISEKEVDSFVGLAIDKMWEKIKEKHNREEPLQYFIDFDSIFRVNFFHSIAEEGGIAPIAGVKELIEGIKNQGLKTAVASSSHPDLIKIVLEASGLLHYFPFFLSGFQVKQGKPEPDIFLEAAARLGVKPEECVVIEDSYNGVTAAKKAGMKCIGFQNPSSGFQNLSAADLVIKSFSEITPEFLKGF
ncbi:MAG: HAD family phosphatase [Spirochaetes bacterium]|nr:HAD family phosphatase [Spirochaetota bacterium]